MPGCPDYLISDRGNVISLKGKTERHLKPYRNPYGYSIMIYNDKGKLKNYRLARLILLAFKPIANAKAYHAVSKDDNPFNVSLDNLEWRLRCGAQAPYTRLSEETVKEIRQLYKQNHSQTYVSIAERYGVTASAVGFAVRGDTWAHIGIPVKEASNDLR